MSFWRQKKEELNDSSEKLDENREEVKSTEDVRQSSEEEQINKIIQQLHDEKHKNAELRQTIACLAVSDECWNPVHFTQLLQNGLQFAIAHRDAWHQQRYLYTYDKRIFSYWLELDEIRREKGLPSVPITGFVPNVSEPRKQRTWQE